MNKLLVLALGLVGCAHLHDPAVGEVRMGAPHAARPVDCKLEFATVSAGDMAPGARFGSGGELEMVGAINIGADEGTDAMSETIRALVRPRACKMGGEVVSLLATGTAQYRGQFNAQQNISYTVWGKRSTSTAPQQF